MHEIRDNTQPAGIITKALLGCSKNPLGEGNSSLEQLSNNLHSCYFWHGLIKSVLHLLRSNWGNIKTFLGVFYITFKGIHRPLCIQPVPDRLNQEISEHFLYIYSQYLYKILNYGICRKDSSGHHKKTFHSQYMKNKKIKKQVYHTQSCTTYWCTCI